MVMRGRINGRERRVERSRSEKYLKKIDKLKIEREQRNKGIQKEETKREKRKEKRREERQTKIYVYIYI